MIVLDASVVFKWLVDEDNSRLATTYLNDHISGANPIAVPELLFYELANVLSTKYGLTNKESRLAFATIWDIELESYHLGLSDYQRVVHWSKKLNLSGYDAVYITLAEKLEAQFITADAKLYRSCSELGFVKLLA